MNTFKKHLLNNKVPSVFLGRLLVRCNQPPHEADDDAEADKAKGEDHKDDLEVGRRFIEYRATGLEQRRGG